MWAPTGHSLQLFFFRSGPQIHLCKQAVTLNSVILEPVPLFTKAGDGVRPFVEVVQSVRSVNALVTDPCYNLGVL